MPIDGAFPHHLLRCSYPDGIDLVKILKYLIAVTSIVCFSSAASACSPSGTILLWFNVTQPLEIINNAASLPNGTVLASVDLPTRRGGGTSLNSCPGTIQLDYFGATGAFNTMSTGIPGVGGRIYSTSTQYGMQPGYLPVTGTVRVPDTSSAQWSWGNLYRLELVKTGAMSAGSYRLPTSWMTLKINNTAIGVLANIATTSNSVPLPLEVKQSPTCGLSSSSIRASLGAVPILNFAGVGSTSSAVPFNIALRCSGGDPGVLSNIYVTLTDQTSPGNVSNRLSLTSGSTASGVGVQILNGSTVLKYGPDSSQPGNTNQWFAGQAGNTSFNIPLTARYVKTLSTVTPGTANAIATFTMSYQ
jgi:type 1 fimbria pilin